MKLDLKVIDWFIQQRKFQSKTAFRQVLQKRLKLRDLYHCGEASCSALEQQEGFLRVSTETDVAMVHRSHGSQNTS